MSFAFIGGALAILNPCGFPLLVAHLSMSMRGSEDGGRPARDGLARGLAVATGFVATLLVVSVPMAFGLRQVMRVLPRAGLVVGIGLVVIGALTLMGAATRIPTGFRARPLDGSFRSYVALGAAQAITALGCTLPVFLAVIGASVASGGVASLLATLGAYGAGAATLLIVVSAAATSVGRALTSRSRGVLRHSRAFGGVMLIASGAYLTYFWWRLSGDSSSSLSADPVVSKVQAFSSWLYRFAGSGDAAFLSGALGVGLSVVVLSVIWRNRNESGTPVKRGGRSDG